MLAGLLYDVRAGDHWEGLRHPGLRLEIVLLRVRSATLVDKLVRIVAASGDWHRLSTTRILLRVGSCTVVRG